MTQTDSQKIGRIRKIETEINNNLFSICSLVTTIAMIMAAVQFFTRGAFPPPGINFFYIGVLILYSLHKEMLRWLEEKKAEKQGEWFVYSWIILTLFLYIINFIANEKFTKPQPQVYVESLRDATITTLEVCAVFVITRFSKVLKITLNKHQ